MEVLETFSDNKIEATALDNVRDQLNFVPCVPCHVNVLFRCRGGGGVKDSTCYLVN